jgi:hypothetical protein
LRWGCASGATKEVKIQLITMSTTLPGEVGDSLLSAPLSALCSIENILELEFVRDSDSRLSFLPANTLPGPNVVGSTLLILPKLDKSTLEGGRAALPATAHPSGLT